MNQEGLLVDLLSQMRQVATKNEHMDSQLYLVNEREQINDILKVTEQNKFYR